MSYSNHFFVRVDIHYGIFWIFSLFLCFYFVCHSIGVIGGPKPLQHVMDQRNEVNNSNLRKKYLICMIVGWSLFVWCENSRFLLTPPLWHSANQHIRNNLVMLN